MRVETEVGKWQRQTFNFQRLWACKSIFFGYCGEMALYFCLEFVLCFMKYIY